MNALTEDKYVPQLETELRGCWDESNELPALKQHAVHIALAQPSSVAVERFSSEVRCATRKDKMRALNNRLENEILVHL